MDYRAVIFDLDGTLLDTIKDLNAASNYALKKNNCPEVSVEETTLFIGNGIRKLLERSLKDKVELLDFVYNDFHYYYYKNVNVYTKPYEGIYDVITYLKNKNVKLAVLSNKEQGALESLCNAHFPGEFLMIVGDQKGLERKPSPNGIFLIAKELGVNIKDIVYIGDSDVDVKTVSNAGCQGIFVSYGFRTEEQLKSAGAKIICDNCYEIIEKLEV